MIDIYALCAYYQKKGGGETAQHYSVKLPYYMDGGGF